MQQRCRVLIKLHSLLVASQSHPALTPNTVELIPTLGALFPRGGPAPSSWPTSLTPPSMYCGEHGVVGFVGEGGERETERAREREREV